MFNALAEKGILLRRGQLVLVSAGAGTGKSLFALTMALKSLVPTLYFSADSDPFTQLSRAVSITAGWTFAAASKAVMEDKLTEAASKMAGVPIRFNYQASPSLGDIETSIQSYEEVYGDYPALIVVDNITNVRSGMSDEDGDPFAGLEGLMDYLHTMARETQACVIGLHHVTGPFNDSDKPVPLSGVKGQISRVPEMILTLFRPGPQALGVSAVKNRGGKSDASGSDFAELEFIGEQMLIRDRQYAHQIQILEDNEIPDQERFDAEGVPW